MTTINEAPSAIVRQIVGRLHVSTSNRAVVRYLASRIKRGVRGFLKLDRKTKRSLMAQAITAHRANRELYACVVAGHTIWKASKRPR